MAIIAALRSLATPMRAAERHAIEYDPWLSIRQFGRSDSDHTLFRVLPQFFHDAPAAPVSGIWAPSCLRLSKAGWDLYLHDESDKELNVAFHAAIRNGLVMICCGSSLTRDLYPYADDRYRSVAQPTLQERRVIKTLARHLCV